MHNAPPVAYPVGRFVWGPRLALALAAVGACALMGWLVATSASASVCAGAGGVWLLAALATARCLPREFIQEGELAWDGEAWHGPCSEGVDGPVQLALTFDGGHFMLVSLRSAERPAWQTGTRHACLRSADMPSRWHGFRCAVYSRRTEIVRSA